jgi:ABC-type glutathione transport system ATPase component
MRAAESSKPGSDTIPTVLLKISALSKTYRSQRFWGRQESVASLRDINLELEEGMTLAVVGESGSGKSTLALCIALERPDSGEVWFEGREITGLSPAELAPVRRKIQVIFQESASALNPRLSAVEVVAEPLRITGLKHLAARQRARECMELVGLVPDLSERSPLAMSGGQRQRLAIARALTLTPKLLILDESFSGLDLVIQEQILALLRNLQSAYALAYLLITHDLGLASEMADRLAILHEGHVVEQGPVESVIKNPRHAQTKALLATVPRIAASLGAGGKL